MKTKRITPGVPYSVDNNTDYSEQVKRVIESIGLLKLIEEIQQEPEDE